ncbi:helix-turn-helix domain-containing protein [Leptolyngbya sp. BC1307]|uniref:helix-turn-helix domain-containing protein n=1 Tax=Leptolyngbya sp. BC1307 TaxID=2029589 RepID=UPI000EFC040F|nr:helix-turn-helix domain-containing protein [Leptolyngbya sp. BC1307]
MSPRPLTSHEQELINQYSYCQLGMTPQAFYAKWQVSQEEMAAICDRSVSTVRRWFHKGGSYRRPNPVDMRHLALMDFLLDHFDDIPAELRNALCASDQKI